MFDYDKDIYFCICGKKIEQIGTCGQPECINSYESYKKHIDEFFTLLEDKGVWKGFNQFDTMELEYQVGVLFELEDDLMLLFLQGLGEKKVLQLLQEGNDALRYRFIELLEPLLDKEMFEEYKHLEEAERENVKELLLYIIDIILQSVQKP